MIVLDTTVISELMKESPDPSVWHWLQANLGEELWTTAITAAEIHDGIAAICLVEEAALATRNTQDFARTGVELINPWE